MILLIAELVVIVALAAILATLFVNEFRTKRRMTPQAHIDAYWRGIERRKFVRFHRSLDATYRFERKQHLRDLRAYCRTADISEGGLRLVVDAKFAPGDILDLMVAFPGTDTETEIEAKVVWCDEALDVDDPSGKKLFHVGVQFCGMRPAGANVLAAYIRSLSEPADA